MSPRFQVELSISSLPRAGFPAPKKTAAFYLKDNNITLKMIMLFVNVVLKFAEIQKRLRLLQDLFSYFEN